MPRTHFHKRLTTGYVPCPRNKTYWFAFPCMVRPPELRNLLKQVVYPIEQSVAYNVAALGTTATAQYNINPHTAQGTGFNEAITSGRNPTSSSLTNLSGIASVSNQKLVVKDIGSFYSVLNPGNSPMLMTVFYVRSVGRSDGVITLKLPAASSDIPNTGYSTLAVNNSPTNMLFYGWLQRYMTTVASDAAGATATMIGGATTSDDYQGITNQGDIATSMISPGLAFPAFVAGTAETDPFGRWKYDKDFVALAGDDSTAQCPIGWGIRESSLFPKYWKVYGRKKYTIMPGKHVYFKQSWKKDFKVDMDLYGDTAEYGGDYATMGRHTKQIMVKIDTLIYGGSHGEVGPPVVTDTREHTGHPRSAFNFEIRTSYKVSKEGTPNRYVGNQGTAEHGLRGEAAIPAAAVVQDADVHNTAKNDPEVP